MEESLKKFVSSQNDGLLNSIQNSLNSLSREVDEFKQTPIHMPNFHRPPEALFNLPSQNEPVELTVECDEKPVLDDRLEYLSADMSSEIHTYLKDCQDQELFKEKNGRSTLSFGMKYTYSG